jgi:hypothetical protein
MKLDYPIRTRMESLIDIADNYKFRVASSNIYRELSEEGFEEEEIISFLQSLIYSNK